MRSVWLPILLCLACGAEDPPPSPPCDQACQDAVAVRSLRETMKLVYNLTLQANPVGPQDESTPCPLGGDARVFGEATSDSMQGATQVALTYELNDCVYMERDEEPEENYAMMLSGVLTQEGIIAVQPSASTALLINGNSVSFLGAVYDPPIEYQAQACPVILGQSGNQLAGTICDRPAGLDL